MDIKHIITFSDNDKLIFLLNKIGIKSRLEGHINFEIFESDEKWTEVEKLLKIFHYVLDIKHLIFSSVETSEAKWNTILAWEHGYPQPESPMEYRKVTYDLNQCCERCNVGAKQNNSFRIKREPVWGKKHKAFQLFWVYDEFFVKPEIWENVFKPFGIDFIPVINKTGKEYKTVVQLKIENILQNSIDMKEHPFQICKICNRKKYYAYIQSYFPKFKEPDKNIHIVKSQEYFGDGGLAFRKTFISQELYKKIIENDIQDFSFHPVEL